LTGKFQLPDCEISASLNLHLSENLQLDIVRRLAEKGEKGIDEFISVHSTSNPAISSRLEQLRKEVSEQGKRWMKTVNQHHLKTRGEEVEKHQHKKRLLNIEKESIKKSQKKMESTLETRLESILSGSDLMEFIIDLPKDDFEDTAPQSFWERILVILHLLWMLFLKPIRRFWEWILRSFGKRKKEPKERHIGMLLGAGSAGVVLSNRLDRLHNSPKLRRKLQKKMFKKGMRHRMTRQELENERKITENKIAKDMEDQKNKEEKNTKQVREIDDKINQSEDELQKELDRLDNEQKMEKEQLEEKIRKKPKSYLKDEILEMLERMNLIEKSPDGIEITNDLVGRFADLLMLDELDKSSIHGTSLSGGFVEPQGIFEPDVLRMYDEIGRMDIVGSIVNARFNHPDDHSLEEDDILILRENFQISDHCIFMFDKSGSMDENNRLLAAKKAILAMYKVKLSKNPDAHVDIIAFDSHAVVCDLLTVWNSESSGFTNMADAIRLARGLIDNTNADRIMIYLISDGLPEAYYDGDDVVAGDFEGAMNATKRELFMFRDNPSIQFTIVLLEMEDEQYLQAADELAKIVDGRVYQTDPQNLVQDLLREFK